MSPLNSMKSIRIFPPAAVLLALLSLAACGSRTQHAPQYPTVGLRPTSYAPPGPPHDPWGPYIVEASQRFDVPQRWIREVMRQESGGRVAATSPVGAMGLMQVMPGTYGELRGRHGLGDDPHCDVTGTAGGPITAKKPSESESLQGGNPHDTGDGSSKRTNSHFAFGTSTTGLKLAATRWTD